MSAEIDKFCHLREIGAVSQEVVRSLSLFAPATYLNVRSDELAGTGVASPAVVTAGNFPRQPQNRAPIAAGIE